MTAPLTSTFPEGSVEHRDQVRRAMAAKYLPGVALPEGKTDKDWDKFKHIWKGIDWPKILKFEERERQNGLPKGILAAMNVVESSGDPGALSPKGAGGLLQFMPDTAKGYGIDRWNPEQAADGAVRHLIDNRNMFGADRVDLMIAAYNCSYKRIAASKDDPSKWPEETQEYVAKVLKGIEHPQYARYAQYMNGGGDIRTGQRAGRNPLQEVRQRGADTANSFDWGSILGVGAGGLFGFAVARILSGILDFGSFGGIGSIFGTIITAMMTVGFALMGKSHFGGWINNMIGGSPSAPERGQETARGHGQERNIPEGTRASFLSREELETRLRARMDKGEPADTVGYVPGAAVGDLVTPHLYQKDKAPAAVADQLKKSPQAQQTVKDVMDAMKACQSWGHLEGIAVINTPKGPESGCLRTDNTYTLPGKANAVAQR